MIKLLLEEVLPDRDHDQADKDRAADEHVAEDDGLLEPAQGAQVDSGEPRDRHTGHADKESVDIVDLECSVAGVEDGRRDQRKLPGS